MVNDRMPGLRPENGWFNLAAKVAIDARVVDEEVAGNVLRVGPVSIRHMS